MSIQYHATITFDALRRWFVSQCYDALLVGLMWLIALLWIGVPFAWFWAFMGGALQFVPNFGAVLALLGPAVSLAFAGAHGEKWIALLIAYAGIAVIDGLILQPYLMKRSSRVPIWASLLVPIVMGIILPFWGVLLAPPLLAVIYAYRKPKAETPSVQQQEFSHQSRGVVLPPERDDRA